MPIYRLGEAAPVLPADGRFWVAPTASVIGNVILGEDVGIWFGAVLRGDNEPMRIGAGTNIQDNAALHSDTGKPLTIGAGCTIGHSAIVHGCTIGDNSLVGMGATILNGARIGANSLIGANALITEGKEFPDNALIVGAPARAIRSLDEEAIAGLRASARHYIENWKRFAAGLTPVR
ncbi:gamma carbonic anhydrase family protein [Pseudochelatococcus contaminans]|uniref:Carbonic anhydrase/acetyltransferase-like protein (Isoleucine patch superfamily) n=1 Tax=Pseudochelatococcus contaminans TaxID=1538103 RepID=A0A7W5Z397_9HYPH|nr:gamma carbonic anhydrase family protein [Pseudochelatococcus contaminans]MBB3809025.1 carbonic anhydrase/acetyltransferase-like protein (isoleucine patch superfamily) [Pseudochelatococcus contaminans]